MLPQALLAPVGTTGAASRATTESGGGTTLIERIWLSGSGDDFEPFPPEIGPSDFIDRASIASVSEHICFALVISGDELYDRPIDQLAPMCVGAAGERQDARLVEEKVTSLERWYEKPEASFAFMQTLDPNAGPVPGVKVRPPSDEMVRIVRRDATICCPAPPGDAIELELQNDLFGDPERPWFLRFRWEKVGGA